MLKLICKKDDIMLKNLIPGMRIIKTVLAVFICLVIAYLINYSFPLQATIACVLMMKSTTEMSIKSGQQRILGTFIGGVLAMISLLLGDYININQSEFSFIILVCVTMLIALVVCKIANVPEYAYSMSCVLILATMLGHGTSHEDTIYYVLFRIIETLCGILIAIAVNRTLNFKQKKVKSEV